MGIELFESAGETRVRQSFDSPTVYLDHWAIRLFSDDTALQNRLIKALLAKGGTLLLSHFSFAEFARGSSPQNCADAEKFLQRALPNIFLTDFRLDDVLARERIEVSNEARFWPTDDLPQLRLFAKHFRSTAGFNMDGFIALAYEHRDGIASAMSNMASQMREALEKARRDPAYVRKARDAPLNDSRPRTLLILGELLRGSNLDPKVAISENDVIDLIHATMPLNCCDFVLLDARWVERIDKMKRRLAKSSMIMPVAQCYSRRNNGIEAFLNNLEAFDPQAQPPPPIR